MSGLNPSEISSVLKDKISGLDLKAETKNEGTIVNVSDGIIRIHGMGEVMYGELVEFENGVFGLALNLEQDSVGVVVLGDYLGLSEGQKVTCTGKILEVPVGEEMLGRVVDALGNPIDGKGELKTKQTAPIEVVAPGVIARQSVDQPVQIGLKSIDAMVPIEQYVAAISLGVKDDEILVDLDYQEDSTADADINIVMTQDVDLIEIQGTAEERPFSQEQLTEIVSKASSSIRDIVAIQKQAVEG